MNLPSPEQLEQMPTLALVEHFEDVLKILRKRGKIYGEQAKEAVKNRVGLPVE